MKITLNNAGKRFGREWVFRNLNYHFFSGKIYAITGANGSGKSTLLQVISSAFILNEGNAEWVVDDRNILSEEVYQYTSLAAPYLELIEEMTAVEFLNFHKTFKQFIQNFSIENVLSEAGLKSAANKEIRFYSSGMKQRLKLIQAIFSDVPFVLLDEPCTNLDASGFDLYYKWIKTLCTNKLVIISSNDKNEYNFCNHQLQLQDYKSN